jgi:hypothetical protein
MCRWLLITGAIKYQLPACHQKGAGDFRNLRRMEKEIKRIFSSLIMKVPDHVYVLGYTYTCHTYCCYAYRL